MNVDGIPNVRACVTPVRDGMIVKSQNKMISLKADPFAIMDHLFRSGFDYYHRFIRPAVLRGIYQRVIRRMAGFGEVPSVQLGSHPTRRIKTQVLIIGDGPASERAAKICSESGLGTSLVSESGGRAEEVRLNYRAFRQATVLGAFDDGVLVAHMGALLIFHSEYVVLDQKARILPIIFSNWDLPGIICEHAADDLIARHIEIGRRILIAGDADRSAAIADRLRGASTGDAVIRVIEPKAKIVSAKGRNAIRSIAIKNGSSLEELSCDALITCGPLAERTDIARQLGCDVEYVGRGVPSISHDDYFETSTKNVFVAGGSAMLLDDSDAARSGEKAAERIVSRARAVGS